MNENCSCPCEEFVGSTYDKTTPDGHQIRIVEFPKSQAVFHCLNADKSAGRTFNGSHIHLVSQCAKPNGTPLGVLLVISQEPESAMAAYSLRKRANGWEAY